MIHEKHNRRSIRLKGYDYSRAGSYFVTICTHNRECIFGDIVDGTMVLNSSGAIVQDYCKTTESHFADIRFAPFVIMPNHFHAIMTVGAGSPRPIPAKSIDTGGREQGRGNPAPTTLGNVVGFLKYQTTKHINGLRQTPGQKIWQRNFYEHVIRNQNDYGRIHKYVEDNPSKWELDSLHPMNGNNNV